MVSEETFQDRVVAELVADLGQDSVDETVYHDESSRIVDILVDVPDGDRYVVEVENTFSSAIKGVGQALLYGALWDAEPVVILPSDDTPEPETTAIRRGTPVELITLPRRGD